MALSVAVLAGLAISAVGAGLQFYGQSQQTAALRRAEDAREKQMALDSMRQRRQIVRNAIIGRSIALFNSTSQGAGQGSGLPGGYGQIQGQAGGQIVGVNQNQEVGSDIFSANRAYYAASSISGFGAGLSSLGGAVLNNAGTIDRLGTYFFAPRTS